MDLFDGEINTRLFHRLPVSMNISMILGLTKVRDMDGVEHTAIVILGSTRDSLPRKMLFDSTSGEYICDTVR
jgi:hypothetical protein